MAMCTVKAVITTDAALAVPEPRRFPDRMIPRGNPSLGQPLVWALLSLTMGLAACAAPPPAREIKPVAPSITLEQVINAPYRERSRARDVYRHPLETLEFFGLSDDMTVVEIWPGGGWYTEILAPYLKERGHYIAAQFPKVDAAPDYQKRIRETFEQDVADKPLFNRMQISEIGPPDRWQPAAPASADLVLSFRNVHNWMADNIEREMFAAFYRVLKPGGVLGVVEHRAWDETSRETMVRTGYVTQDYVIQLATEAGFTFVAWEEINANPLDTKDYSSGVWTLPPVLRLGDKDRQKYLDIGEADRMTLKFVKAVDVPAKATAAKPG